jgi:hypothetical protein
MNSLLFVGKDSPGFCSAIAEILPASTYDTGDQEKAGSLDTFFQRKCQTKETNTRCFLHDDTDFEKPRAEGTEKQR